MSTRETRLQVYAVVRSIPKRRLLSYADVAERSGMGRGAAQAVGSILSSQYLPEDIPWHRVVRQSGKLPQDQQIEERRLRLLAEGVPVGPEDQVDLPRFRWTLEKDGLDKAASPVQPGDVVVHKVGDDTLYVIVAVDDDGNAECEYFNDQEKQYERIFFASVVLQRHS